MSDISEEIRKYFPELIKPLARNTSLKEMFHKMKVISKVISKFKSKMSKRTNLCVRESSCYSERKQ